MLGERFRISADEDEDDQYLSTLIAHYQTLIETVKRTTKPSSKQIVAILAGILAVDEYCKLQQKSAIKPMPLAHSMSPSIVTTAGSVQNETEEAANITNSILSKIDEII